MSDATDGSAIQKELSDRLDEALLHAIKDGVTMLDENNEPKTITAPAAMLNVARQRLKDLGIGVAPVKGTAAKELQDALFPNGVRPKPMVMPSLEDDEDPR